MEPFEEGMSLPSLLLHSCISPPPQLKCPCLSLQSCFTALEIFKSNCYLHIKDKSRTHRTNQTSLQCPKYVGCNDNWSVLLPAMLLRTLIFSQSWQPRQMFGSLSLPYTPVHLHRNSSDSIVCLSLAAPDRISSSEEEHRETTRKR